MFFSFLVVGCLTLMYRAATLTVFFGVAGLPMLIFYVCGLPLCAFVAMRISRKNTIEGANNDGGLRQISRVETHYVYGMFYTAYKRDMWW